MVKVLVDEPTISQGDVEMCAVDCTDWLDSGEVLTGTPTVTEVTTTDLTIANKVVNSAAITVKGVSVAIGAAIQFKVSGQLSATGLYTLQVACSTDATPARTITRYAKFRVE